MQDDQCDLLDAFLRCIVTDEGFAHEIAVIADQCEQGGNHAVAAAMRNVSCNHQIRGMEGRAQIAALITSHTDMPDLEVE